MRLTIPTAALAAALAALLLAACDPQDGSAPAASNSARQNATTAAANNAGQAAHAAPNDGVRRVPIAEARAMAERGEAVIYDVRDEKSYEANHVAGAKLIPLAEVAARAAEFPKDKLVITYCA
jgi:multidrug efflux pump subunit AcrA (membrane-fusion protein)